MKIFLDGKDNSGWSIDIDRKNIRNSLKRLGIDESYWFNADIIHNIWWNTILNPKKFFFRLKKNILVTTSNFVNLDDKEYVLRKEFEKVNKIAKAWIVPSTKQKNIFESHGIRAYYQPFYLDLSLFKPFRYAILRDELLKKFDIAPELVKNKVIIGSFQRDTLGSDLTKPKWQKGPELLIELLKELPKDRFLLLLAGPRRNYVINECKKYAIPYHYIGNETIENEMLNSLSIENMPYLYALTDIYLVTSKSEGGPKAIMEAAATKTFIFSTDVGLAKDFLNPENIFDNPHDYKKALHEFVRDYLRQSEQTRSVTEQQHKRTSELLNDDAMDRRLLEIYSHVLKT